MTENDRTFSTRPITVLAGADDNYARYLTVAVASVLATADPSRPVHAVIADGGITEENRARLLRALRRTRPDAEITIAAPDLSRFPVLAHNEKPWLTAAALLRLLMQEFVPAECDRVLYVDCDTVTVEDVGPLFDRDLSAHAVWAVADPHPQAEIARLEAAFPDVRFPEDASYFCSGVMLVDLDRWRAERIGERALERAIEFEGRWGDQDALNLTLLGDWGALEDKWDNQIHWRRPLFPELFRNGARQGVLHYAGRRKPWQHGLPVYAADAYFSALFRTGWLSPREEFVERALRQRDMAHLGYNMLKRAVRTVVVAVRGD